MLRFTRDWQLPDYLRSLEGARAYGIPISKKYTALQFYNAYSKTGTKTVTIATSTIKYGRLYNWPAVNTALFAPNGWHVPTETEIETLITTLGGDSVAGGKLKETGLVYWDTPNTGATNEYDFNGRGSGARTHVGGFEYINIQLAIWTATEADVSYAYYLNMGYNSAQTTSETYILKKHGFAVRFIKDTTDYTEGETVTDIDGNSYRVCQIGTQVWLADNWACTKLNDGTPIANITDGTDWSNDTTGAYCDYDNDEENTFDFTYTDSIVSNIEYFIARRINDTRHVLESFELNTDLIVYENGQYLFDETKCFDGYLPDGVYFFEFNNGYETYRSQIFNVTDFPLLPMGSGAELGSSSELSSSGSVEIPDTIILRRFEVDSDYYQFEN
jgi:uncharacterized protein (TIGR02145 family)